MLVAAASYAAATLPPHSPRHPEAALYYGAVGGAFGCYLVGLALLRRRPARLTVVLALAALIQLAPLPGPLLLSQDAGAYWDYGRIAALDGGNPYSQPPSRFRSDPAYRAVAGGWRGTTSVYGPLFTLGSEGVALGAGPSVRTAAWLYKGLAAAGSVALACLAAALSRRRAFAAAAVGWNPLLAIVFAGGGHNDVWMMVPLLAALLLEARGRRQLAGALWALAAAVKWIPLVLLPLRAAAHRRERRFGYAGFAAAALVLVTVSSAFYGDDWLRAFLPLTKDLASGSRDSVERLLRFAGASRATLAWVLAGGFAVAYAALLAVARSRRTRLGLTVVLLLVATPWILPWYVSWALPLAAAEEDGTALGLAVALSGYLLEAHAPL